jgi:hypothetical protein
MREHQTLLTAPQTRWLSQSRYALRTIGAAAALFAFLCAFQVFYTFVFLGPDSEFAVEEAVRRQVLVVNALRGSFSVWIALAVFRLDGAIGQVLKYDAAPAAVNRAVRLGRNVCVAVAAGFVAIVAAIVLLPLLQPIPT